MVSLPVKSVVYTIYLCAFSITLLQKFAMQPQCIEVDRLFRISSDHRIHRLISRVRGSHSPTSRPTWLCLSLKNLILESVLVGLLLNH